MQICHGYGDSFRFYLGMAMEYALLNTEEEQGKLVAGRDLFGEGKCALT